MSPVMEGVVLGSERQRAFFELSDERRIEARACDCRLLAAGPAEARRWQIGKLGAYAVEFNAEAVVRMHVSLEKVEPSPAERLARGLALLEGRRR